MNKPELTLIIPAYNVEKYISRCLDSVLGQSYLDYELIIVDDCSKDTTASIIEKYAQKDTRIQTVFSKVNKGPADTRQIAIDMAKGTYIMFMDADDRYINKNALEIMIGAMKKTGVDCVSCRFTTYYSSRLIIKRGPKYGGTTMTNQEFAVEKLKNPKFHWHYLVIRCYKRDIIVDNNIRFKSGLLFTEDMKFNNDYMLHAKDYYFINDYLYEYNCANENSITKSRYITNEDTSIELLSKAKAQFEYHKELYKSMNLYSKCRREIASIMYLSTIRLIQANNKTVKSDKLNNLLLNDVDYLESISIIGKYTYYIRLKVFNEFYLNRIKYNVKRLLKHLIP